MSRGGRWLFLGLAAAALLLLAARGVADGYVDYRWYQSLDAAPLWWAKAENVALLKLGSIVLSGAFIFANLYAVRQSVALVVLPRRVGDLEIGQEVSGRALLAVVAAVSVALAVLLSMPAEHWVQLASARWGESFRESDSRFQADLGFWVYWLPLERALYERTLVVLAVVIAVVTFVYGLTQSVQWERGSLRVSTHARRHLSVLSGIVLVVLGWSYRLDAFGALIDGSGPGGLPAWVDHKVNIPASLALALVAVIAGAVLAFTGWAGQTRLAFGAATSVLALSLALRQLAPAVADRVGANEARRAAREAPYVATRAAYTRRAFGADQVDSAAASLAYSSPEAAAAGVPVWDAAVFESGVERTRRLGGVSGSVGVVGPATNPVLVAAERPAAGPGAPDPLAGWQLVRGSATRAGSRGEALSAADGSLLDEDAASAVLPAFVFDSAGGYLRVADSVPDVAGVDVRGPGARLALALSQQNLRLLGEQPGGGRVVLHRDLRDRLTRLAPFFVQGRTATPAVADGALYWIVHLYSASLDYPVSRPLDAVQGSWRYLRHAAVAVVDAYRGRVTLVPDAAADPVAATWIRALPGLFSPWSSLPPEVQRAVPPAVESGVAQAAAYAEFGARGDTTAAPGTARLPEPDDAAAPLVVLPPNEGTAALSVPVVDGTRRVSGLVLVLGGPAARTVWYPVTPTPADTPIDAVLARLYRTPEPAAAAAREGRLERGPERVVPVAGGVGYVVPHYAVRGGGAPALVGATTYFAGEFRDGATAIAAVRGARAAPVDSAPPADSAATLARARSLYEAAREALRAGDWARFGEAYERLGAELRRTPPPPRR